MTNSQLYDEAFAQMGSAPLEPGETQPPRRRAGRPRGTPNPNGGRPALPEDERRQRHTITLDPDVARLVRRHAKARGNSLSESVNILLGEALRQHTVDAEAEEVY